MGKILNNKVLLFTVAILLLANIGILIYFVWMKEPGSHKSQNEKQRSPVTFFLKTQIGFSEQQIADFEKMRQENRKKIKPLSEDIRLAKIRFFQLLNEPAVADSILVQKASAIGEKQKALDLQAFQNFTDIRKICTPQQRQKYDSLVPAVIAEMWFSPPKRK